MCCLVGVTWLPPEFTACPDFGHALWLPQITCAGGVIVRELLLHGRATWSFIGRLPVCGRVNKYSPRFGSRTFRVIVREQGSRTCCFMREPLGSRMQVLCAGAFAPAQPSCGSHLAPACKVCERDMSPAPALCPAFVRVCCPCVWDSPVNWVGESPLCGTLPHHGRESFPPCMSYCAGIFATCHSSIGSAR